MEPFDRRSGDLRPLPRTGEVLSEASQAPSSHRTRTPKSYSLCDHTTGGLIVFMLVFTPWAFGTTQTWSIWTMNVTGFALGFLLLLKRIIRGRTGYQPSRWPEPSLTHLEPLLDAPAKRRRDPLIVALAILTLFVLSYILVSAINARAHYIPSQQRFEYLDCIRWLPHSYDRAATWNAFWMYSGLACFFWATRDWLLTKAARERRRIRSSSRRTSPVVVLPEDIASRRGGPGVSTEATVELESPKSELPFRLRLLLWVLCINGAVLALEAILQRLSGTNKLLWLVVPRFNDQALGQFGPYAYRTNAATYFNLIWPVCLGFWLILRRAAKPSLRSGHRVGSGNHIVLLPGAVLMAACPIISASRGGALIAVGAIAICMGMLLRIARSESLWFRVGTCSLFLLILGFSAVLGMKELVPRFQTIFSDQMSRRTEIYENALPMARDFPVLGAGAGAFGTLYQLYRTDVTQVWAAYVHDDWLETRISFGWIGFTAIVAMLGAVLAYWFFGAGIPARSDFVGMIWVAVGGALLHAKFDFPFQIYSILWLFLLLCAILVTLSRPERPR